MDTVQWTAPNRDLSNAGFLTRDRVNNMDFVPKRGEVKIHFLQFIFPHNSHTGKAEISPHDNFSPRIINRDIRDKYELYKTTYPTPHARLFVKFSLLSFMNLLLVSVVLIR